MSFVWLQYYELTDIVDNTMEIVDLLNIVLPTFIVIFIGYLLGKLTKMNMSAIVDVVFYVG